MCGPKPGDFLSEGGISREVIPESDERDVSSLGVEFRSEIRESQFSERFPGLKIVREFESLKDFEGGKFVGSVHDATEERDRPGYLREGLEFTNEEPFLGTGERQPAAKVLSDLGIDTEVGQESIEQGLEFIEFFDGESFPLIGGDGEERGGERRRSRAGVEESGEVVSSGEFFQGFQDCRVGCFGIAADLERDPTHLACSPEEGGFVFQSFEKGIGGLSRL